MNQPSTQNRNLPIIRGPLTWYCYLSVGFFTYLLNIQGNILPFLQSELQLSYRDASLHFSAIAVGMIIIGLFGDRITRRLGRRNALWLASASVIAGALAQCAAPNAAISIASCLLYGFPGALIPAIVFGLIGEIQGEHADAAIGEASAITYVFGMAGTLAVAVSLALALGWRAALVFGAVTGAVIVLGFRNMAIPEAPSLPQYSGARLPGAFWAYWCVIAAVVALEFSTLFWAPAYLERVAGLSAPHAAASAAAFSVAMIVGRSISAFLVRRIASLHLLAGSLAMAMAGFAIYWGLPSPVTAMAGLFIIGLGVAPLYPLTVGLAIQAAGPHGAAASARFMLAVGLSIISMPLLLGSLADGFGLWLAHLVLPGLVVAAAALLAIGVMAQRRAV